MKLSSFTYAGRTCTGVVVGDELVELGSEFDGNLSLPSFLQQGPAGLHQAEMAVQSGQRRIPLSDATLLAPVRPRKFFAIGLNYADHVAESGLTKPEHITVFYKAATSVNAPFASVELPAVSDCLDYEGELGIVIGTRCRHVRAHDAPSVIGGYVIVNDVSVRDWQLMTPQWSLGKSFDTHGPLGPYLVTPDEVGDPHSLNLKTYVNGELRQSSNTSNLIFDCYDIVEFLSQACTLEPGDVIATGTPSGVAAAMEGRPWLVPGDRVRVEIDRLGAIESQVVAEEVPADYAINPTWLEGRSAEIAS